MSLDFDPDTPHFPLPPPPQKKKCASAGLVVLQTAGCVDYKKIGPPPPHFETVIYGVMLFHLFFSLQ